MFSNQGRIYAPQPATPVQPAYPQPPMNPMAKGPPVMRPFQPHMGQPPMGNPQMQQPGIMGLLRPNMGGGFMGRTPGY